MPEAILSFDNQDLVRTLFGERDRHLRKVRESVGVDVVIRGDELHLFGTERQVERGREIIAELQTIIARDGVLLDSEVARVIEGHGSGSKITSDFGASATASATTHAASVPANGHGSKSKVATASNGGIEVFERAKKIHPRTAGQAEYVEAIRKNEIVLCVGPAGSGKTYLAVAMAVNSLRQEQVRKIVLVRPAVEAGERLGFLPGDLHSKLNPYLRPLLDALNDILSFEQVKRYMENDVIEIVPLAYMRGRTLNNTFMILDEGQNTTVTQMKMFLTRMGQESRIVATGDVTQIDLPPNVPSGMIDAVGRLGHLPGLACVHLTTKDIVRHRLVAEIVRAYDDEQPSHGKRRPRS
jgi:phosphate starvation-inducible PhoH-like protein